jgi:hypothetical protein
MQVSQKDSQNPNIIVDSELQRVIEAGEESAASLKTAIYGDCQIKQLPVDNYG